MLELFKESILDATNKIAYERFANKITSSYVNEVPPLYIEFNNSDPESTISSFLLENILKYFVFASHHCRSTGKISFSKVPIVINRGGDIIELIDVDFTLSSAGNITVDKIELNPYFDSIVKSLRLIEPHIQTL